MEQGLAFSNLVLDAPSFFDFILELLVCGKKFGCPLFYPFLQIIACTLQGRLDFFPMRKFGFKLLIGVRQFERAFIHTPFEIVF